MSGGVGMGGGDGRKCGPTRHWLHHARAVRRYRWQLHPTTSNPSHHMCLLALSQGKTRAGSFSSCYWRRLRPCAAPWHSHRLQPLCNSTEMFQGTPLPEGSGGVHRVLVTCWKSGLAHMQISCLPALTYRGDLAFIYSRISSSHFWFAAWWEGHTNLAGLINPQCTPALYTPHTHPVTPNVLI